MKKFLNCEIANDDFPQVFLDSLKAISNYPIIKVFPRKKGITSGKRQNCFWNSSVISQTFGGEVIYGYAIKKLLDERSPLCEELIYLYGHGCWKTPEDNLVDVTPCYQEEYVYFLPLDLKLKLNGKSTEFLRSLYFPRNIEGIAYAFAFESEESRKKFNWSDIHEKEITKRQYSGYDPEDFEGCIDKLIFAENVNPAIIDHYKKELPELKNIDWDYLFQPLAGEVTSKELCITELCPTLNFKNFIKEFIKSAINENKVVFEYAIEKRIDLFYRMYSGLDETWSNERIVDDYICGISTATGKKITDYDLHKNVLDQHKIPKNKQIKKELKKRVEDLNRQCWKGHISYKEFLILSNPYLYPHPSLVNKIGAMARLKAPLNRIKIAKKDYRQSKSKGVRK